MTRTLLTGFGLAALAFAVPGMAAEKVHLSIDAFKPGAKIDRNIFGQFAEHLGHGIYEGIWVGPDSAIPNTRGIRNDVVAALRALKVPNVRWPGGCFADEYHWRKGIGPLDKRVVTLNTNWGGVTEPNTFGTHEFMDFVDQIGSEAYISVNVGSGTPQEAAEWLEYLTTGQPTTLAKERAANGHPAPYKVGYLGIGNESWDCGGNMTVDYYLSQLKIYSRFVRNFNPAQQGKRQMLKIAVGPGDGEYGVDREPHEGVPGSPLELGYQWSLDALLHGSEVAAVVCVGRIRRGRIWPNPQVHSGNGDLVTKQSAIMDKYDPEKKVAMVVDEWGAWYAPLPGTNPGFLVQQNSLRDAILASLNLNIFARHADRVRMANIAQMINVLQAMIITDKEKMVLTPTYHVFKMYRAVPGCDLRAGRV